ncbi:MAG: DUF296 domain-containing protein [Candidatus Diapherotrites archaeon]|nr:DUF296 domain-containing protein [Candidatus Diapherotrites archaeon]
MGQMDSQIFRAKGTPKTMILELDEDEDLFESLRTGMMQHNLERATVESMEGTLKNASVNYMLGSQYKYEEMPTVLVRKAHGKYELMGKQKQLHGNLHAIIDLRGENMTVTVGKGKATAGFKIRLSFIEITPIA